jgi:DNA invertase Pin-like site-specific DNA recombinase
MPMSTFVGYFRVSTDQQGASGLGLGGQHQAVERFLANQDPPGKLAAEFTELNQGSATRTGLSSPKRWSIAAVTIAPC